MSPPYCPTSSPGGIPFFPVYCPSSPVGCSLPWSAGRFPDTFHLKCPHKGCPGIMAPGHGVEEMFAPICPVLEPPQRRGPAVRGFVEMPRIPPRQGQGSNK